MNLFNTLVSIVKSFIAFIVALVMALSAHSVVVQTPSTPTAASTTTVVQPAPATTATTAPAQPKAIPTTTKPPAAVTTTTPAPAVQTAEVGLDPEVLNTQTRAALVNVLCTTLNGGTFKPISGSGILVDSRGVVLTNAHVGQFFLLKDYRSVDNINCTIRTGSPAQPAYAAKLLYLPPAWVDANADQLVAQQATGTGQNDYAFLLITGTTNSNNALPTVFPHLEMSAQALHAGQQMLLAAYPAGFLSGELIAKSLYASSAFAYVTQLFTFDDPTHTDLFSIGGSIESQQGSSGGAAVRLDGTLAGVITTAVLATSTGQRDLRAVTLAHINRSLAQFGQGGIVQLLTGDLAQKATDFNTNTAPSETKVLEAVLNKQ